MCEHVVELVWSDEILVRDVGDSGVRRCTSYGYVGPYVKNFFRGITKRMNERATRKADARETRGGNRRAQGDGSGSVLLFLLYASIAAYD